MSTLPKTYIVGHRGMVDLTIARHWQSQGLAQKTTTTRTNVKLELTNQAALGSVPRSLADPIATNDTNITGFLNMLVAARDAQVQSFTYAASSSTYGDHPALPKVEETIGLRYFNVFGLRQDPNGAYAAVIPKWTAALLQGEPVYINGDGETSRDFCFVANAVQANILAACSADQAKDQVYNVAVGVRTTLNQLYTLLRQTIQNLVVASEARHPMPLTPEYRDFRAGDVRHSQADICKARTLLGFEQQHNIKSGINATTSWHVFFKTSKH